MTSQRAVPSDRAHRWARVGPVLWAIAIVIAVPTAVRAQTFWRYDQDVHFIYEFDDNVREELNDPVHAQVAKISYRGDMEWGESAQQRLSMSYQGGFKRHFGLVERETDVTNQFVNEGTLTYLRRISRDFALSGTAGVKNRKWTDGFFFINEDGFTRLNAQLSAHLNLRALSPDNTARLEVGARYYDIEFENLDASFGNHMVGGYLILRKDFAEDFSTRWSYSLDQVRYPGRGALEPGDDATSILRGVTRDRQEDLVHELGGELTWQGPVSVQAEYYFRYNDSNSFGFTWLSHNVGIQVTRWLPWGMLAQAYGLVELRDFSEPIPNFTGGGSLDTGEAANNVLLLRLVKDIRPDYSIEVRYGRYRNESITLDDFFTKNVYAVGVRYRP